MNYNTSSRFSVLQPKTNTVNSRVVVLTHNLHGPCFYRLVTTSSVEVTCPRECQGMDPSIPPIIVLIPFPQWFLHERDGNTPKENATATITTYAECLACEVQDKYGHDPMLMTSQRLHMREILNGYSKTTKALLLEFTRCR